MNSSKNPMFRDSMWEKVNDYSQTGRSVMTLGGTIRNTFLLLVLLLIASVPGWQMADRPGLAIPVIIGSVVGGLVLAIIMAFKPQSAPVLSPIYAVIQGLFVGVVSNFTFQMLKDTQYSNAIPLAVTGTLVTMAVMLGLYASRVIRVTDTMRSIIIGMTLAVGIFYLLTFALSFAFPQIRGLAPFGSGIIGIGFSVFVIGLAAFNFLLDFDNIERGVDMQAPKYMEWYCAFGLLVTLVWLYIEILNLFRKLAGNR